MSLLKIKVKKKKKPKVEEDTTQKRTGIICGVCKRPVILFTFHGMEPYEHCSDFCSQVTGKELTEFVAAKPGDYVVFPCAECGCPVEGEWEPTKVDGQIGSCCWTKRRLRFRTKLLHEVLAEMRGGTLKTAIAEELKR